MGADNLSPVSTALAKKLANPIAALISVPLQYNYDQDFGPEDDGSVSKLKTLLYPK